MKCYGGLASAWGVVSCKQRLRERSKQVLRQVSVHIAAPNLLTSSYVIYVCVYAYMYFKL